MHWYNLFTLYPVIFVWSLANTHGLNKNRDHCLWDARKFPSVKRWTTTQATNTGIFCLFLIKQSAETSQWLLYLASLAFSLEKHRILIQALMEFHKNVASVRCKKNRMKQWMLWSQSQRCLKLSTKACTRNKGAYQRRGCDHSRCLETFWGLRGLSATTMMKTITMKMVTLAFSRVAEYIIQSKSGKVRWGSNQDDQLAVSKKHSFGHSWWLTVWSFLESAEAFAVWQQPETGEQRGPSNGYISHDVSETEENRCLHWLHMHGTAREAWTAKRSR